VTAGRHRARDAGQAFPIYLTAVAGLLFLAFAYLAVGQAGAIRNSGQTAADAAALAAGQDYRDQLRTAFLKAVVSGSAWQDILRGQGIGTGDACDQAQWFAGRNDADVTACEPGYLPASFTVTVRTRRTVGKSVIPGTEHTHATAKARAVVEPRCTVDLPSPSTLPVPPSAGDGGSGGGAGGQGGSTGRQGGKDGKSPIGLTCDGRALTIDPVHPDLFPDAKDLFAVQLAD
jgi:hypothetical protein